MKQEKYKKKANDISYPENLICDIGIDLVFTDGMEKPLSDDQIEGLDYAIETLRGEYEKEVIDERYRQGLVFSQIAKNIGKTESRSREICRQSVEKLRHRARCKYIRLGISYIRNKYQSIGDTIEIHEEMSKEERDQILERTEGYSIDEMELSVRAYNCLFKHCVNTLSDLVSMVYDRPSQFMRACGNSGVVVDEVFAFLQGIRIDIPKIYNKPEMKNRLKR